MRVAEHHRRRRFLPLMGMLLATVALGSVASSAAEPVRPDYTRRETERRRAPERSQRGELPAELRIVVDAEASRTVADATAPTPRAPQSVSPEIRRRARTAALRSANHFVATAGRREYFRVGFHRGLRDALDDPKLGEWDFHEGQRRGYRDFEAHLVGEELGRQAARQLAFERAEEQVAGQFHDLSATPRFDPVAGLPAFVAPPAPIVAPSLGDVFEQHPIRGFASLERSYVPWIVDWNLSPAQLYRCEDHTTFHDAGWRKPASALAWWKTDREQGTFYRSLSPTDRRQFEAIFSAEFPSRVAGLFTDRLLVAFDAGLDAGWFYGAFVRQEWDYRRGFHEGFVSAFEDTAMTTFRIAYGLQYRPVYRERFDEWSSQPKPEIVGARLLDGNRDGVFEPGEEVAVDYELVNYGGIAGRLPLELAGRTLEESRSVLVDLPARSTTRGSIASGGRVRHEAPVRTMSDAELELAGEVLAIPFVVSYPLELRRQEWRVDRDNLHGEVRLDIEVENASRRSVEGRVELRANVPAVATLIRDVGRLAAGEVRTVSFEVTELEPLDLMAGEVALDVKVLHDEAVWDSHRCWLPDTASDLSNRDLLFYMVDLARRGEAARQRVEGTRSLLIRRLEQDWQVAAAGNGNPYKTDFKKATATTALGDLVRTSRQQGGEARRHPVFHGLSDEVLDLAEELPGTHPFLRKFLRKLARQLP